MPQTLLTPLRSERADAAIVFVHGFGGNPSTTWGRFPDWLVAETRLHGWDLYSLGYTTRLVPDLVGIWSADAPLSNLALLLSTTCANSALSRYKSLCLVAHSMGGLITQRALVDQRELT